LSSGDGRHDRSRPPQASSGDAAHSRARRHRDRQREAECLRAGAVAFLKKPVEKERLDEAFSKISSFIERGVKKLLIVDDDETQRGTIMELLGDGEDVNIKAVGSGEEALELLDSEPFDCMVLD